MKDPLASVGQEARLVEEREARLVALDASIARGIADADAGRVRPISEVFENLESRLETKKHPAPNQKG
jgi:predicted transcriptional regulator